MTMLGIETSAVAASAAICSDGKLISEFYLNNKLTHSTTLMPMVEAVLKTAGLKLDCIDVLAVSTGPGSFTGLRIGISTIKGLAAKNNISCIGISSLEGLAYSASYFNGIICPVMDARRQQVYNAIFKCQQGEIERLCPDRAISISELCEDLEKYKDFKIILVGDGADLCYNIMDKCPGLEIADDKYKFQRATGILSAALKADKSAYVPAAELIPVYLRLSQAERERLERQLNK